MNIFKRILGPKENPSLDSVSFDTSGYQSRGEAGNRRAWSTPDGDGVGLFFFPKKPDLPAGARTVAELQACYRGIIGNDEIKTVEFRVRPVGGVSCVWMIIKVPRQPSGLDYIGSLTIPFAEFSFVVKMQCEERGVTGMREAVLLLELLPDLSQVQAGFPQGPDGKLLLDGNPDDECYDSRFPDHPVSRLRRNFVPILKTLQIRENIRSQPKFELPDVS